MLQSEALSLPGFRWQPGSPLNSELAVVLLLLRSGLMNGSGPCKDSPGTSRTSTCCSACHLPTRTLPLGASHIHAHAPGRVHKLHAIKHEMNILDRCHPLLGTTIFRPTLPLRFGPSTDFFTRPMFASAICMSNPLLVNT